MGANFNPTEEEIRKWAYNPNAWLMDQDEDLILHRPTYLPVLMELSTETSCPKQDYIRNILGYYGAHKLGMQHLPELAEMEEKVKAYPGPEDEWLRDWKTGFLRVLDHLKKPRKLKYREAEDLARYLVAGPGSVRELRIGRKFKDQRQEFYGEYGNYRLHIYFNLQTGVWKLTRNGRQQDCPV